MLSLRKNSQDISETTCKWIPLPPLTKEWCDEDVYAHFNLSKDDIKLIDETNIVGYKGITKPQQQQQPQPQPPQNIIIEKDVKEEQIKIIIKRKKIVKKIIA